jgi:hypothetical protein
MLSPYDFSIGPYSEPFNSSPCLHNLFLECLFQYFPPIDPYVPKVVSSPHVFHFVCMSHLLPACCVLSVLHRSITFIIFSDESILQSSSLCIRTQFLSIYDFLYLRSQHSPQQYIFQQPKLCSVLRVWVLVACPHTTISIKFGEYVFHTVVYKITTNIL